MSLTIENRNALFHAAALGRCMDRDDVTGEDCTQRDLSPAERCPGCLMVYAIAQFITGKALVATVRVNRTPARYTYTSALEDAVARLVRDWPVRGIAPALNHLRETVEEHSGRDLEAEAEALGDDR